VLGSDHWCCDCSSSSSVSYVELLILDAAGVVPDSFAATSIGSLSDIMYYN
jgi:hypothetical protein